MNFQKHVEDAKLKLEIAPLIDVVFLLLIYFLLTAALIKKEGDISFMLPSSIPGEPINLPVEALIEISAEGVVMVEGMRFSRDDENLEGLVTQLRGLEAIAKAQSSPFFVNILPNQDTLHKRIIDVMDACAEAGVKNLSFSQAAK